MKAFLSLAIPAWLGLAVGASTDNVVPKFWYLWGSIGIILFMVTVLYIAEKTPTFMQDNDSKQFKTYWRTIIAVLGIGTLCFAGAAAYDRFSGGPEARQASLDSRAVLDGFENILRTSECVNTYTNADNTAQANLLLAFGSIIESAAVGEPIKRQQIVIVHAARVQRQHYLVLANQVNERCDLNQPGGQDLLEEHEQPDIPELEDINGAN